MQRGWACVDGSIVGPRQEIPPELQKVTKAILSFDYANDERLMANGTDFMKLINPEGMFAGVENWLEVFRWIYGGD